MIVGLLSKIGPGLAEQETRQTATTERQRSFMLLVTVYVSLIIIKLHSLAEFAWGSGRHHEYACSIGIRQLLITCYYDDLYPKWIKASTVKFNHSSSG